MLHLERSVFPNDVLPHIPFSSLTDTALSSWCHAAAPELVYRICLQHGVVENYYSRDETHSL